MNNIIYGSHGKKVFFISFWDKNTILIGCDLLRLLELLLRRAGAPSDGFGGGSRLPIASYVPLIVWILARCFCAIGSLSKTHLLASYSIVLILAYFLILWYMTRPLLRPLRPGSCLNFGFQYALMRNNRSKKIWGRIFGLVWLKLAVAALNMYQTKDLNSNSWI